jgi:hypothetical protein
MNSAQRAALNEVMRIGGLMSNVCFNLARHTPDEVLGWDAAQANMRELHIGWDAARNRYFELEAEAKQSRTAQQMARKGLGRKSTAGR